MSARSASLRKKNSSAVPLFTAVTCQQSAPDPQGKGEIHKRVETAGVYPLVRPRGVSALPAEVQRKTSRPLGANPLTQFEYPAQPVQKRSRPSVANTLTQFASPGQPVLRKRLPHGKGEHAYAVRVPRSAGAEKGCRPERANPPARFRFPDHPMPRKRKKAPLTRCLSPLRICRPLSSSSCRNYRSRRRYYHHRYRRNRSRRCPDRSIPRSG